ncbi:pentapeptide repeat-containing protein [Paraburkholderia sp. MM5477-R1]|uniref:pentapeptide repeat-containing protein n=1 Tax=Paraburkholderia sp. MM5477-R1 TaxID=2991062 RepID=UPI003D1B3733
MDRLILSERNFRGANFESAILTGADFRHADLEGASFADAHIEGAQFDWANLTGAVFWFSFAEASNFSHATSPGARFEGARLEAANFSDAHMEAAEFSGGAEMVGAIFNSAELGGSTFRGAHLKGSSFSCAKMAGVDLSYAQLFDTDFDGAETPLIDLRGTLWDAFSSSERETLSASKSAVRYERNAYGLDYCRAPDNSQRRFDSCLTDTTHSTQFVCFKSWYPAGIEGYRKQLYGLLTKLACSDAIKATALLRNVYQSLRAAEPDSRLEHEFLLLLWNRRQDPNCQGVQNIAALELMLNADPSLVDKLPSGPKAKERPASGSVPLNERRQYFGLTFAWEAYW